MPGYGAPGQQMAYGGYGMPAAGAPGQAAPAGYGMPAAGAPQAYGQPQPQMGYGQMPQVQ